VARPARIPTQDELNAIVELKSKGISDEEVATSLSTSRSTFAKWKKMALKGCDGNTVGAQVTQAIKVGMEARLEKHLSLAVDAVDELLSTYNYEETTVTEREIMGKATTETKTVTKRIRPNPMVAIFTLVNRDPEHFRSINQPIEKDDDAEMPDGIELEFDS
jgi:hypothetical protein